MSRIQWSDQEKQYLIENYAIQGIAKCAVYLNRSESSVSNQVFKMKLKRDIDAKFDRPSNIPLGYQYCCVCKQILNESFFHSKRKKTGRQAFACKSCRSKISSKSWNKRKQETYYKAKLQPEKNLFNNAKNRAKKDNIPFNIELSDIIIPQNCPVLGIPLIPFSNSDNSPSLDQLIPNNGYIKGNIEVISKRANTIKNNATSVEVQKVADWMKFKGL